VNRQDRLIYAMVLERDQVMTWAAMPFPGKPRLAEYLMSDPWVCVAPLIDRSQSGLCSGEMTRDHVHEHTGGTKGKRPPTTMETVVILCQGHHLNSFWATSHRPAIRAYIREANERYREVR